MTLPTIKEYVNSMKLGGSCGISSAARTGVGLRCTASTSGPALERRGNRGRSTSKDGSHIGRRRALRELPNDEGMGRLVVLEATLSHGTRDVFDWNRSKTSTTMISLWLMADVEKCPDRCAPNDRNKEHQVR